MQTKKSNKIRSVTVNPKEIAIIIGCLLGDGTLSKSGKDFRLRVEQKEAHSEYVHWKFEFLKRLCISKPKEVKAHKSLRFGTCGHPVLSQLRSEWYINGKKVLPNLKDLESISIAIWFMDDGCKHRDTVNFSVHNFSLEDILKLQNILSKKSIKTSVVSDGKGKRLYVLKESYPVFKRLVKPYIVKCMAYKLP